MVVEEAQPIGQPTKQAAPVRVKCGAFLALVAVLAGVSSMDRVRRLCLVVGPACTTARLATVVYL